MLDADPKVIQQINFTANLDRAGKTRIYLLKCFIEWFNFYQYKMTQYNSLNVKLPNSQLDKIKSTIEDGTEVVLRLSTNMISDSDDKINFPHELLLTNRQVANLCKAFANKSSTDIKLSKTQISKMMQSGGFLDRLLGSLLKTGLPLMKNLNKPLAKIILIPLGLTAAALAADVGTHKKILGSSCPLAFALQNNTILIISNDETKDINRIVKSLEDSGFLFKGLSETIQNETKEQGGGLLSMLLGPLGASLLGNILAGKGAIGKRKGWGIYRAGEGVIRAGYGNKRRDYENKMDF